MQNGELRYFSTFSGIGGFELGIERACDAYRGKDGGKQTNKAGNEGQGFLTTSGEEASPALRQIGERPPNVPDQRSLRDGSERSDQEPEPSQSEILQRRKRPLMEKGRSLLSSDIGKRRSVRCVGYSEIDKYAAQIYQRHYPNHTNYGDITKIQPEDLPDFDLFVGGFPCQAFSVAGLRRGFEDTRGTLFFEIARICKVKQPRLLLLENVKGLLSHDQGYTFRTIISTLDELGYDLQWQVLNSKNHGVPQNRERIFIVGHLRGTSRPEVFPFGANGEKIDELPRHVSNTLTRRYEGAQAVGTYVGEGELDAQEDQPPFITDPQGRKYKQDKPSAISPTLRAQTHGNQPVVNLIRRLTPTECERLQGFPDGWTEGVSDTQRYKCLGNAVTVNVIQHIAERLLN